MSEAQFRVRLDTRRAKTELRGLLRESARTAGSVAARVRSAVGTGLGTVGLGAGVGTGIAAIRGATSSGLGDILGETFGQLGASINEFIFGDLDDRARAANNAREQVIQTFRFAAGASDDAIEQGYRVFEQLRAKNEQAEIGQSKFEQDPRFYGPGITDVVDRLAKKLLEGMKDGFNALIKALI